MANQRNEASARTTAADRRFVREQFVRLNLLYGAYLSAPTPEAKVKAWIEFHEFFGHQAHWLLPIVENVVMR